MTPLQKYFNRLAKKYATHDIDSESYSFTPDKMGDFLSGIEAAEKAIRLDEAKNMLRVVAGNNLGPFWDTLRSNMKKFEAELAEILK